MIPCNQVTHQVLVTTDVRSRGRRTREGDRVLGTEVIEQVAHAATDQLEGALGQQVRIDQNLAHRRILYEEAIGHFRERPASGQSLLFPVTLEFGLTEIVAVRSCATRPDATSRGISAYSTPPAARFG